MFYVYLHKRKDNNQIFYVGKGKLGRHLSKSGRNKKWLEIVETFGYFSQIVYFTQIESLAFEMEFFLIQELRHSGVFLCNLSAGGQGASGVIHTDETKKKFRDAKIGRKQSPDHAEKSRKAKLGKKQPSHAVESLASMKRKKIMNSKGQVFDSSISAAKHISKELGVNASLGNISMCALGKRNQAYGMSWRYVSDGEIKPASRPKSKKLVEAIGFCCFFSCSDAARHISEARKKRAVTQNISQAARENRTAYGFNWKYITDRRD